MIEVALQFDNPHKGSEAKTLPATKADLRVVHRFSVRGKIEEQPKIYFRSREGFCLASLGYARSGLLDPDREVR
jgi:hypothetical protein